MRWLAAKPTLEDDETLLEEFAGLVARLTLTDKRIILSRFGHRTILYEDVRNVLGGWNAGPTDLRDNATVIYGIYLLFASGGEEWAMIPEPARAAELIRMRAPLLD